MTDLTKTPIPHVNVTYLDALIDGAAFGLTKGLEVTPNLNNVQIDEQTQKLLNLIKNSRDYWHIVRLLSEGRTQIEHDFGIAYATNVTAIYSQIVDPILRDRIRLVINGEGVDSCMWWTFAPYLYHELLTRGMQSQEAVKRIILWAKDGISVESEARFHTETDPLGFSGHHLQGLRKFNGMNYPTMNAYVLSKNPNGPSHLFTAQEAKNIVTGYLLS